MIIIAGYTRTDETTRDRAVAAFGAMVEKARKQEGCLDFSLGADAVDAGRINVFECWRDQQALDAWRRIAKGPRVALREACVKLYRTDAAEEPFQRGRRSVKNAPGPAERSHKPTEAKP